MSKNSGAPSRAGAAAGSIEFSLTMPRRALVGAALGIGVRQSVLGSGSESTPTLESTHRRL